MAEKNVLMPINYLAAGLFKDVRVKYNNSSLPDSTKQMYYFQTLISMLLGIRDTSALRNFKSGLWFPDSDGTQDIDVQPAGTNKGGSERYKRFS